MKVKKGESKVSFSEWTRFGLGYEKMEAIFYPGINVLEVMSDSAKKLDKILSALRRYRESNNEVYRRPVEVRYW